MRALFAFGLLLVGCVTDPPVGGDAGAQPGTRGGPCLAMNQCVQGLTCVDGTCVQLPDSGVPDGTTMMDAANDSATDTGADTGADAGCLSTTSTLNAACKVNFPIECVSSAMMVECVAVAGDCTIKPGKVVQCHDKTGCGNMENCCLDMGATTTGSCPTSVGLTSATYVSYCSMSACTRICLSDMDCDMQKHCRPAKIESTNIVFGLCQQ